MAIPEEDLDVWSTYYIPIYDALDEIRFHPVVAD